MGAWGTGIFEDDLAADVKKAYVDLRSKGAGAGKATESVPAKFASSTSDADERPVLFLALAAAQLADGVIDPRVKDAVIEINESGSAMARWKDASEEDQRSRKNSIKQITDVF